MPPRVNSRQVFVSSSLARRDLADCSWKDGGQFGLLSIGCIISAIIGYYFLGENVNLTRIAGIALICFGIVVISRSA